MTMPHSLTVWAQESPHGEAFLALSHQVRTLSRHWCQPSQVCRASFSSSFFDLFLVSNATRQVGPKWLLIPRPLVQPILHRSWHIQNLGSVWASLGCCRGYVAALYELCNARRCPVVPSWEDFHLHGWRESTVAYTQHFCAGVFLSIDHIATFSKPMKRAGEYVVSAINLLRMMCSMAWPTQE
jgi:hypothetical protein